MRRTSSIFRTFLLFFIFFGLASSPVLADGKKRKNIEDEVFYFVIPDRFYNAEDSNDTGGISGDRTQHGFDPTDRRYFHGGDLKGLTEKLKYLDKMGVTALWISPPFKNKPVIGETAAYHGYWAVDYTQVDPHWGTNEDLKKFIKAAHKKKIKVFLDVVANHTADVIKFEECHDSDGNGLPGVSCGYRSTEEIQTNPYTPFVPAAEANSKVPAWLNDTQFYHNQGDSTFAGESSLNGDFFGLDDLKTEDPQVVQGMIDVFKFWISEFKIDGFRVDTIKHVNTEFWQQWVPAIEAHAKAEGIKDFFIFGEAFDGLPATLAQFTRNAEFPSVLDFGLYFAIKDVVADTQGTDRLAWVFGEDDQYTTADSNANQLMNFASNHDVGRIGHFIQQRFPNITDEEALSRAKLAQSLIFLSRGIPVIYYGDEQGFTGDGEDSKAREDMFASQVPDYNDNDLIGTDSTTADDNFDQKHPIYKHIKDLQKLYQKHDALRLGQQYVRQSSSEPGLFVVSKFLEDKQDEYVIAFNTSTSEQAVSLEVLGEKYKQIWPLRKDDDDEDDDDEDDIKPSGKLLSAAKDDDDEDDDDEDDNNGILKAVAGSIDFSVPALEVVVLESKKKIPLPKELPEISFADLADGDLVSGLQEVKVNLNGLSHAQVPLHRVSFEMKVGDGAYQPLGIDYNPDYRVFVELSDIENGTPIQFRATVDNYKKANNQVVVNVIKDVQPGMTIYFEAPETWDNVNIYWWNAAPQAGTDWPGVAMTKLTGNWYSYQFEDGVKQANLIFNNGAGEQTTDLYREGDGCYQNDTWFDSCDIPEPALKVYFKKPATWGSDINIYYWEADPSPAVDWPGIAMVAEGNDWYSHQFAEGTASANLIFNDGTNQTSDLSRTGDGCYVDGAWQDTCDTTGGVSDPGMTVYFQRPLDWNVPNVHYWYEGGGSNWPGEEMDALGDDWYALQLPDGVTAANMVINDKTDGSNGNQTGDLYREGDGCYDLTTDSWTDTCAIPGIKLYFQKPESWSTANIYWWEPQPSGPSVGWPGEAMADLGDNWYSYQMAGGVTASNVIFNNAGAPQTSDLYREGNGCYTIDGGWTDTCDVPQPGMTVYFQVPAGWGDSINIYYWNVDGSPGWPGVPMQSLGDGWYAFTFPQGVDMANLIFNDGQGNQTADLYTENGGCYGEFGDSWRKSCITPEASTDVEITNIAAHWLTQSIVAWNVTDNRATQFRLYHSANASIAIDGGLVTGSDGFIEMAYNGGLSAALQTQSPHLASWSGYELLSTSGVSEVVKSQLVAVALDQSNNILEATRVQIPRVLDDLYDYQGSLGVTYVGGVPQVSIWAPTAQSIELIVADANGTELSRYASTSYSQGTYTFVGDATWDKQYYRFELQVFHPVTNAIETVLVSDPYAVSLSENALYAQFLDLENDASLKPANWDSIQKALPAHADITLYEGHVRDFSQNDSTVPEAMRGKYMAFTQNGVEGAALSNGMAHLQSLQQSGLSHFHLLPVFDISSINEDEPSRVDLDDTFSLLCGLTPDATVQSYCATAGSDTIQQVLDSIKATDATSADIQAIVATMTNLDSFNWGYDPQHFNAPEGSYASATDGATRVLEFREMVKALDEIDLNVVMDVVYNHTSASGLWDNSVLDKVVPGYYHRLNPITGAVENSTCCDNTATEHEMMEKLMVDTLVHWAKQFKVDSFRFDLMGHVPKSSMVAAQQALAGLTLANDGVDGANIYLYGEGWDFGEVAGNQRFEQATQFNMAGTGIGTFNDRIRSAVRGGNFTDSGRAQGWANGNEVFPNGVANGAGTLADQADRIRIGLAGNLQSYQFTDNSGAANTGSGYSGVGYTLDPQESVNYVDKHDNESLWDNTQAKLPDSMSAADRVRVHMLSNSLINYGQGIPFYQMGTDILRSKSLDRNSYNSGDWFNAVDFSKQDNNWASGLPLAQDNQTRWTTMAEIINNGNISVSPAQIALAHDIFKNQLEVRYSSPLFRLSTAEDVQQRVGFHNTGASQTPGIIAMTISDGVCAGADLDPNYDGALVLFNSDDQAIDFTVAGTEGSVLHPVLASGADSVVQGATVIDATYSIPAHSAAVFMKPQTGAQGTYPCNPDTAAENQPGIQVYFKKPDTWTEVRIYFWDSSPASVSTNWPGEAMQEVGDGWFSYQFPNGVSQTNLIFNNNNNGEQTADLFRDADGCYDFLDGFWTDTCTLPGLNFKFQKPVHWSDDIHIHYWNAEGIAGTSWPGLPMTSLGDNWFEFQMPEGVRSTNLIFNDANTGTGEQTSDLFRNANGCYVFDTSSWSDSCTTP